MPPPRPTILVAHTGYVCSACRNRFQQRNVPPWVLRNVSTRSRRSRVSRAFKDAFNKSDEISTRDNGVKFFEEGAEGQLLPKDNDTTDDDLESALNKRIKALENELDVEKKGLRSGPYKEMAEQLIAFRKLGGGKLDLNLPKELGLAEDEAASEESLSSMFDEEPDAIDLDPIQSSSSLRSFDIPRSPFPTESHAKISRLNSFVNEALSEPEFDKRRELWKRYAMTRSVLSTAWHEVPSEVWEILWREFSIESIDNPDRMAHIKRLGEDMEAANVVLGPSKFLLFIEALFLEGDHERAINRWEDARPALTLADDTSVKYWSLGSKMLAHNNQPEQAQQAAAILLNNLKGDKDPRVLIPLINAWLSSDDVSSLQRAWGIYVRLKYRLGSNVKMSDFDDVISIFLGNDLTEMALAVFRDMMLIGDSASYHQDSVGLYTQRLKSVGSLNDFEFTPEELTWTSHKPLTMLPKKLQNKFFFGKWIKKLIGDGHIDWAAKVADLMSREGIRPDPRYQNGIIGAWLRSGSANDKSKAETLAWRMISARLDFVKRRGQRYELEAPIRLEVSDDRKKGFSRPLGERMESLATLETFSVLIDHYQETKERDRVQELMMALRAAKIPPSTSFLNGLLDLGARTHRKAWSWSMYVQMVHYQGVVPNLDTFEVLWRRMQTHVDPLLNKTKEGFPSCRALFSEMVNWTSQLQSSEFPRELYEQIIACFGIADDQLGAALALRSMKILFGQYPDEDTVRTVVVNLAKAGLPNVGGFARRRQYNINANTQKQVQNFAKILKTLRDERVQDLQSKGVDFDSLDDATKSLESLQLLCRLLESVAESKLRRENFGSEEDVEHKTISEVEESVAEEMGVLATLRGEENENVR